MVSLAVVAVLIALMLPHLASVKENARQVVCRSNVRQIGIGMAIYADDNQARIPATVYTEGPQKNWEPHETLDLRLESESPAGAWDGLGHLYAQGYLPAPKLFYCPSHRGLNHYKDYADSWSTDHAKLVGNYQYRGKVKTNSYQEGSIWLDDIAKQRKALVADGMRTRDDYNHGIGSNVLRADLSVYWFNDAEEKFALTLPKDGSDSNKDKVLSAWSILDKGGKY